MQGYIIRASKDILIFGKKLSEFTSKPKTIPNYTHCIVKCI